MTASADAVLAFWRGSGPDKWFKKDTAFDDEIRRRFLPTYEAAARVELVLPETGVCSRADAPGASQCCGGPTPSAVDACCVDDANARQQGKAGCGCG